MVPLKISDLKFSTKPPKNIIIHSTSELVTFTSMDNNTFQIHRAYPYIYSNNPLNRHGYHFIIENYQNEFYPIAMQPLFTKCIWEDMDPKYHSDIHVAVLGNYDMDIPLERCYKVLAYKILCPFARYFRITYKNLLLHSEISNSKTTCPGYYFEKERMLFYFRAYMRRISINRGNF